MPSRSAKTSGRTVPATGRGRNGLLVPLFVGSALVLGGASAPAETLPLLLQVVAGIMLVIGVLRARAPLRPVGPAVAVAAFAFAALVLVQLAPLPPSVWNSLPGREAIAVDLAWLGIEQAWRSASLSPNLTVASALAALPAAALLALLAGADEIPLERTAQTLVVLVLVSWFLAVFQAIGGRASPFYLHAYTNWGLGVGFFANANHLATLLVVSVPVVAALAARHIREQRLDPRFALAGLAGYAGIAALGITLTGSVAGMALLPLAVIASLFVIPANSGSRMLALGGAVVAGAAAAAFSIGVLGTSVADSVTNRPEIWRNTFAGIEQFWPLGAGLGTFAGIYPLFENPDTVIRLFANHAHNDYLEILFETGMIGAVLIAAGLVWWSVRSVKVWRAPASEWQPWQRTASIVTGVVLAHSAVDYPLRTPALLVVFVFFCVVLASDRHRSGPAVQGPAR